MVCCILPKSKWPQHHKPDIIRAIGYKWHNNTLTRDKTYKGDPKLQFIELKYNTDHNMHKVEDSILSIYTPLKQAVQNENPQVPVESMRCAFLIDVARAGRSTSDPKKSFRRTTPQPMLS